MCVSLLNAAHTVDSTLYKGILTMKQAFLILGLFLLINPKIGISQMDANSMITLLNFSKSLIQDGEMSFLFYEQFPVPPEEKGKRLRDIIAFREQELRDADKDEASDAYRKTILKNLENEKRYEPFRDSDEFFIFAEVSLVFQNAPDYADTSMMDYRMEIIGRFENHLSLGSIRFFNAGYEYLFLRNGIETLQVIRATQFDNSSIVRVAGIDKEQEEDTVSTMTEVTDAAQVPPTDLIDVTRAQVHPTEFSGEKGYIITYFSSEDEQILAKVYVRLSTLPEVFREEFYFQSESPNANADGFWLRLRKDYSDFHTVDGLNLAVPKVRLHKEFRENGGLHRQTVYILKEMDFNLGLSEIFFEWQEADLDDGKGNRKEIREIRRD